MHGTKQLPLQAQRGVSLTSLIIGIAVIMMIGMFVMKVFPFFMEYRAAKSAIVLVKNTDGPPLEQRRAFERAAEINRISTISPKDLIIYKVSGQTEVAFDYETKIPLFTNVSLVVRWADTTDPSGVIPEKPATTQQ
jgi:hypothetical protein